MLSLSALTDFERFASAPRSMPMADIASTAIRRIVRERVIDFDSGDMIVNLDVSEARVPSSALRRPLWLLRPWLSS